MIDKRICFWYQSDCSNSTSRMSPLALKTEKHMSNFSRAWEIQLINAVEKKEPGGLTPKGIIIQSAYAFQIVPTLLFVRKNLFQLETLKREGKKKSWTFPMRNDLKIESFRRRRRGWIKYSCDIAFGRCYKNGNWYFSSSKARERERVKGKEKIV